VSKTGGQGGYMEGRCYYSLRRGREKQSDQAKGSLTINIPAFLRHADGARAATWKENTVNTPRCGREKEKMCLGVESEDDWSWRGYEERWLF